MALLRRRTYSVRVRILAAILAVTALGLVVAGGVAFLLQQNRLLGAIDDELHAEFEGVQSLIEGTDAAPPESGRITTRTDPGTFQNTSDLVHDVVWAINPPLGGGTAGVVDGEVRFVSGVSADLDLDEPAFIESVVTEAADGVTVIDTATLDGRDVRFLAVPLATQNATSQGLFVSAIAKDARLADLGAVMTVYAWVALGVVVVVALVGWFVAGRLLHPVRELRRAAAHITAGALDERIPVTGNDDLSDLTETMNAMIARLEESFTGQRRIVNDVRHELATPVTIVRGHLELLDPNDPDDVAQTRAIVMEELDRMSALISEIAALAEAERASLHRVERTDMGALTRDVFEKVRVIPDREWVLGAVARGEAVVDPARLTQAWLQLADNAAKYSEPGGRIELGSAAVGEEMFCWVADEGSGIPPSARTRIFERFGRAEDTRGAAGSGLGLSIVQALVRAHGGRIELDSEVGRGSTFTMVIPRTPEVPPETATRSTVETGKESQAR